MWTMLKLKYILDRAENPLMGAPTTAQIQVHNHSGDSGNYVKIPLYFR